jgi:hypothetical protein
MNRPPVYGKLGKNGIALAVGIGLTLLLAYRFIVDIPCARLRLTRNHTVANFYLQYLTYSGVDVCRAADAIRSLEGRVFSGGISTSSQYSEAIIRDLCKK